MVNWLIWVLNYIFFIIWLCANGKEMTQFVIPKSRNGFSLSFLYDKRFRLRMYVLFNSCIRTCFLVCLMSMIVRKPTETVDKMTTVWDGYFRFLPEFYPVTKLVFFYMKYIFSPRLVLSIWSFNICLDYNLISINFNLMGLIGTEKNLEIICKWSLIKFPDSKTELQMHVKFCLTYK